MYIAIGLAGTAMRLVQRVRRDVGFRLQESGGATRFSTSLPDDRALVAAPWRLCPLAFGKSRRWTRTQRASDEPSPRRLPASRADRILSDGKIEGQTKHNHQPCSDVVSHVASAACDRHLLLSEGRSSERRVAGPPSLGTVPPVEETRRDRRCRAPAPGARPPRSQPTPRRFGTDHCSHINGGRAARAHAFPLRTEQHAE